MHVQALPIVNATQAWVGRNGYLKGGNQGFSKRAFKIRTVYTGLGAGSGTAQRRDFQTRSLQRAQGEPLLSLGASRNTSGPHEVLTNNHSRSELLRTTVNCGP